MHFGRVQFEYLGDLDDRFVRNSAQFVVDKVAHALQDDAGGAPTWRQFKQWLVAKDPGGKLQALEFTTRPLGLMRTAAFMNKTGQLSKAPGSWKDLVFPPVYPTKRTPSVGIWPPGLVSCAV